MPRSSPYSGVDPEAVDRGDVPPTPPGSSFNPFDITGEDAAYQRRLSNWNTNKATKTWEGAKQYAPDAQGLSDPSNYQADYAGLQDVANSHGLTAGTKSAYQAMQQQTGQHAAAQRQGIEQQMVSRGMGQSGLDYAAQLQAGQAGADAAAMGGYAAVGQGENARNAAIGQMAGIRANQQQDYAHAQEAGLEQVYQNYMNLAAGETGQYNANAQGAAAREGQDKQAQANGTSLLATVGTAALALCDERAKHNVNDGADRADTFMDALRPRTFEYIDPANGDGERLGIMAQDVERVAPGMVLTVGGLKRIDLEQLVVALAATVGRLNERLRVLEGS